MHPLSCYLLCLWVYCRSSYSCWFVNCLSPTRCHLSAVPQSPSHVGRSAWRLPTSLTCSNRPHLRHTPPDPSGINSFSAPLLRCRRSFPICPVLRGGVVVVVCVWVVGGVGGWGREGREGGVGGVQQRGCWVETMRGINAGRKVHDNGCVVQTAAARTAIRCSCIINAAAESSKKKQKLKYWVGLTRRQ